MQTDEDWKYFEDRAENYSLRDFFDFHQHHLPMMVIITQGHCGETELESLPAFQVLWCHKYSRQKRVVAKTHGTETVSIPISYSQHFRVLDSKGRPVGYLKTLKEIVETLPFPLKVEIAVRETLSFSLDGEEKKISDYNPLILTQIYDVTYIEAFGVDETRLDETPILVPLYLKDVRLSTIFGIKGKSQSTYTDLQEAFNTTLGKIEHTSMYEDIAVYSKAAVEASQNVYEFLQPCDYLRLESRPEAQKAERTYETLRAKDVNQGQGDTQKQEGIVGFIRQKVLSKRPTFRFGKTMGGFVSALKKREHDQKGASSQKDFKLRDKRLSLPPGEGIYVKAQETNSSQIHKRTCIQTTTGANDLTVVSVSELTIDEMTEKLKELKLGHHVPAFREKQIDGCLAADLSMDMLKWELHFSTFEAMKFLRFIETGHVPR